MLGVISLNPAIPEEKLGWLGLRLTLLRFQLRYYMYIPMPVLLKIITTMKLIHSPSLLHKLIPDYNMPTESMVILSVSLGNFTFSNDTSK